MDQSITFGPLKAAASTALYCIFLLQFQIWLFREIRKEEASRRNVVLGLVIFTLGYLVNTLHDLYVFYLDQPPITSGSQQEIQDSQRFHQGLKEVWLPFAIGALIIDLVGFASYLFGKHIQCRSRTIGLAFIAKLIVDSIVLTVYLAI